MRAGFYSVDITPRVGVGLCGFGPYLNRYSRAIRDTLKARAAAFEHKGERAIVVSCDLIGVTAELAAEMRERAATATGVASSKIMIHCTHTHSGPNTGGYIGWGEVDPPYIALLPHKIASLCAGAVERLGEVTLHHAAAPCHGVGLNREYDKDAPPLEDVLEETWSPAKPELTDTVTQVLAFRDSTGGLAGFMAYFGCHPVVCCEQTHYIHGDYCGVAMGNLEREYPGSVGMFLQGAQGDVNSCVVHKPEQESLLALDIIAARFANAVRSGLKAAKPLEVERLATVSNMTRFSSKDISLERIEALIKEQEAVIDAPGASDTDHKLRMAVVTLNGLRQIEQQMRRGIDLSFQEGEVQGVRVGPVVLLSAPFEIMQAIKNDVVGRARAQLPLVMGITNGSMGYAPDKQAAARGGYAADIVPMIVGRLPYRDIHSELVEALLEADRQLDGAPGGI